MVCEPNSSSGSINCSDLCYPRHFFNSHLCKIILNSFTYGFLVTAKQLCEVKYPYKAQNEDELSIREGDIVTLVSKDSLDPGWWRGELNGKVGVFPDNFVTLIPSGEEKSSSRDEKKTAKVATETGRNFEVLYFSVPKLRDNIYQCDP